MSAAPWSYTAPSGVHLSVVQTVSGVEVRLTDRDGDGHSVAVPGEALADLRTTLEENEKGLTHTETPDVVERRCYPITSYTYSGAGFLAPCTAAGYGSMCGATQYDHEEDHG